MEALAALQGRCLFYPCAGDDWAPFLEFFGDHIDEFHFCDIGRRYEDLRTLKSVSPFSGDPSYQLVPTKTEINGREIARLQRVTAWRPYRMLEPGWLKQVYERITDGRQITVIRRRGFGQYALGDFANRSIGIFVHRGDSPGEGGSNVYFLANRNSRHKPLSRLFDKLTEKLADRALIVSDGSLVDRELEENFRRERFSFGAFEWRRAGYISRRDPRIVTPIWEVTRLSAA